MGKRRSIDMTWRPFRSRESQRRDRADEMKAHIELAGEELVAGGLPIDEARREARRLFGNPRVKLEEIDSMGAFAECTEPWRTWWCSARGRLAFVWPSVLRPHE